MPTMTEGEDFAIQLVSRFEQSLVPGVWLRQTEAEGQFVEIVLPLSELQHIVRRCERDFPRYALRLCERLSGRESPFELPALSRPEVLQVLFNTHLLGSVLARHGVLQSENREVYPFLEQAFGLALRGRLRLTAEPLW